MQFRLAAVFAALLAVAMAAPLRTPLEHDPGQPDTETP